MESMGAITPSTLSRSDLPWQIAWSREKCTPCGPWGRRVPARAIEPGVFRKRTVQVPVGLAEKPGILVQASTTALKQRTGSGARLLGCGMWAGYCPNGPSAGPKRGTDKLRFQQQHPGGGPSPQRRGRPATTPAAILERDQGRSPSPCSRPALGCGTARLRAADRSDGFSPRGELGRKTGITLVPPVREIYPSSSHMSLRAFSPQHVGGLQMGVAKP